MDRTSNALREPTAPAGRSQATRFKKGRSGNPRGRPKARKLLSVIMREAMGARIPIVQGGKRKRITKAEALVQLKLNEAIKGDAAAIDFVISLAEKAGGLVPAEMERQGGVLVVPGVAKSTEEWERLHGADARGELNYESNALRKRPKVTVPISIEAGDKLIIERKLDEALACFRRVFRNAVSVYMRNKENVAAAQEAFDALLRIGYGSVHFNLERRFDTALECVEEAIEFLPVGPPEVIAQPLFWLNLHRAIALMFVDRVDEARESFTVHIGERFRDGNRLKTWESIVLSSFDSYRTRGIAHPFMDEVETIFAGD